MIGKLIKQPNGKYCISKLYDAPDKYNLTEQDIIDMFVEEAKACISDAAHYGKIIENTIYQGTFKTDFIGIPEDTLKEMGFDKSYEELVKFIPLKPIDTHYVGSQFTTYGKCPTCGENVENCMGYGEKKCRNCDQALKW